jgi:phage host-nuclease inhibitor protein Gam
MSDAQTIIAKLDELADLRTAATLSKADYEERRAEILKAVQDELDALDAEFKPLFEAVDERAQQLEAEIKEAVLYHGESVKGAHYNAVYTRGRVTWDTRRLDAYARHNPEVLEFRKEGQPSVSLRNQQRNE